MRKIGIFFLAFGLLAAPARPQPAKKPILTRVMIRAVSRDAKVIGTHVGGAQITVRDLESGKVLAEGVQLGGTGDTRKIMIEPRARDAVVYNTPGTAGFLAKIPLTRPTHVEITAEGPLGYPQATQKTSKTLWLVPGKDILGEGILLEIHGFIVEILEPAAGAALQKGQEIPVRARLRMT